MTKRLLLLGIAALASGVFSFGQDKQAQEIKRLDGTTIKPVEIDDTVTKLMKAAEVPGLGLALFNGGQIAYLKAYGVRDKEKNLPLLTGA
jgi:CubicO group peptidase (beta-lactamase class C family)